jgi:hypothetical protein
MALEPAMAPKTRLDPLVKWKERELDAARRALAARLKALADTRERIEKAQRDLTALPRGATNVDQLELIDRAVVRARKDLERATAEAEVAAKAVATAQVAVTEVHRRVEIFRRASERQRTVLIQEAERSERRTLDELALLLRKPS